MNNINNNIRIAAVAFADVVILIDDDAAAMVLAVLHSKKTHFFKMNVKMIPTATLINVANYLGCTISRYPSNNSCQLRAADGLIKVAVK